MNPEPPPKYTLLVQWSDEDRCWIGRCPDLMFGGVHGDDRQQVYVELCEAVDEQIAIARQDGTPLPKPRFGLAVFHSLHAPEGTQA